MNQNNNIVFYQASNGTYHAASPQEQIYETSNIQLPLAASTTVNETTHQYQEVFNGKIIKAEPLQQIKIINTDELIQSNNVIHNVVSAATETDEDNALPFHRFIRVSGINPKGKGFQLITDHLPEANVQPKTFNTSYMKTLNMNGTITRTVLVPQNTYTTTQVDSNESILSGQYIVTHNDISSIKPKTNIIRDNSFLVQTNGESNGVPVQYVDTIQRNGKILIQRIRRKNVRLKNGTQVKNITSAAINTNGTCYRVPISAMTPVPLGIKPMKKILVQQEGLDLIGVEQVQGGQLHVVTDDGKTVPVKIEGQNNVLYDPPPQKARIVFKVMQPEDFQLYSQAEVEETKKVKHTTVKSKQTAIQEKTITLSKVVTRSGRQVRPPKHITTTYDGLDGEDILDDEFDDSIPSTRKPSSATNTTSKGSSSTSIGNGGDSDSIVPAVMEDANVVKPKVMVQSLLRKKRIQCVTCKKVYSGAQCMGNHLFNFPEHATTEMLTVLLEQYRAQRKAKELKLKLAKPVPIAPDLKPQPQVNGANQIANTSNVEKINTISSLSDDLECKEERNIFVSLVGIVERTSEECKASVFVRQLSALILKLKRLMPCLLYEDKSSSSCMINESVGKMLEVKPGKYKLNMNAIKCLGEQGGNCPHIPPKSEPKPIAPSWLTSSQNNAEKISTANTLITNGNCQDNGNPSQWASNINDNNQSNQSESHKWPSIISDNGLGSNQLNKWKSPVKSKKKIKNNSHKWPSTVSSSNTQIKDEVRNWAPITDNNCQDKIELSEWKLIPNSSCQNDDGINKWTPMTSNDDNELSTWAATVTSNSSATTDELHKWTNSSEVDCQDKNEMQWTTTSKNTCQDDDDLCKWKSTVTNGCQVKDELSEWTSALNSACQNKDELNKWKNTTNNGCQIKDKWSSPINNGCQEKDNICKWTSTISNDCQDKDDLSKWTSNINNGSSEKDGLSKWSSINNSCQDKDDLNKWSSTNANGCQDKDELDKWTSTKNNGKRKWIPIGTRDPDDNSNTNDENWLSTNSDLLLDNATFPQTVDDNIKSWDPVQKQSRLEDCTPRSPWQANIPELNKIDIPQEIIVQQDQITSSSQPVPSDDSLTFDCATKMVEDIHSNLVFDMNKDISLDSDVGLKKKSIEPKNFDFNDSRFDMQIDSDKLNFRSAQYNEMKYGPDILPPFRKIEQSKNLQLPVDSLSDISSDVDKLPLPSTDGILSELGSESLGLTISNEHIEPMDTVETRKDVTLNQSEDAVHCDEQSLLNSSDLNLPISTTCASSRNESILSVSESSLDSARLNLSSGLNLLDSLGTDCLSFTDSDLRTTSQMSLDLQDLFPFHHS